MFSSGATPSVDTSVHQPDTTDATQPSQSLRGWLQTWRQVLIAELLHILERRNYSGVR
jgi:hypothetical protein